MATIGKKRPYFPTVSAKHEEKSSNEKHSAFIGRIIMTL